MTKYNDHLRIIYGGATGRRGTISIGQIAAASGISADVDVSGLVSRHSAIVGSTGSGKSNLVTVTLESISDGSLPNARVIVIDPHGEYATALGSQARVFRIRPNVHLGEQPLWVPFWALPFSELQAIVLGALQPNHEAAIRDRVREMKVESARLLVNPPPAEVITADSPIPFSVKRLWYDLDKFERLTFKEPGNQTEQTAYEPELEGNPDTLTPDQYPAASPYNNAPYKSKQKRNIERQLDLMRSRLRDSRFSFLFSPGDGYAPDISGSVGRDLDYLVREWVGHDRPISVFDVSDVPGEVLPVIVGTMLQVVYDILFWAQGLPIGGRKQPLLIVLDEAHRFVPEGGSGPAHRVLSRIAKEGRKYGAGLMLVSQRPSEVDAGILSQCGSLVALRLTNAADRSRVAATVPDDLGGLVELLPSLRTGEAILLGQIMPIPSRVRVRRARNKTDGNDPTLPDAWQVSQQPNDGLYIDALWNWRVQSTSGAVDAAESVAEVPTGA